MEIFNVGPLELIIILILMFVLLGPKEMVRTAARIGSWVRKVIKSPMWREVMGYSQEIRELPQKIMDESGLKETIEEVRKDTMAATDEINASLKEVAEAARVKEAEHLRIDFNAQDTNTIAPPAVAAEAAAAAAEAAAAADTTGVEGASEPAAEPAATEQAETVSPSADMAGAIAAAAAAAEARAEAKAAAKPRKPRARKQTSETPAVVDVALREEVALQEEVALPTEPALPAEPALPLEANIPTEAQAQAEAAPAEEPKVRKPRRKKSDADLPAVVPVTVEGFAQQAAAPVENNPEIASANGNGNGNGAVPDTAAPVKRARKPRAPKAQDAASTVEETPTPEEQSHRDAA